MGAGPVALVLAAALLHIALAGWGSLFNETDGQYGGAAKVMASGGSWLIPENNGVPRLVKPPLLTWLIAGSMTALGQNEFAVRLPGALAMVGWVWVTYAIGSAWAGARRGLLAGGILATMLGSFTLARIAMPEPVFSALIAAAILCFLKATSAKEPSARRWMALLWICGGLAAFVKGPHGLAYPLATALMATLLSQAISGGASRPLRTLFSWLGLLAVLAINLPWYAYVESQFPGYLANQFFIEHLGHVTGSDAPATNYTGVPRFQFVLLHLAWFFPWSVACLVALPGALRQIPSHKIWGLVPWTILSWAALVLIPVLLAGQRQDYYAMAMWPCFALMAACLLERSSPAWPSRIVAGVLVLAGVAVTVAARFLSGTTATVADRSTALLTVVQFGPEVWSGLVVIAWGSLGFGILFCLLAKRSWLFLGLAAASVGIGAVAGTARVSPFFSLADIAPDIESLAGSSGRVMFDGDIDTASSLLFYTRLRIGLLGGNPEADFVVRTTGIGRENFLTRKQLLSLWQTDHPVTLVIEKSHLEPWSEFLGTRLVPLAHCGTLVVVGNPSSGQNFRNGFPKRPSQKKEKIATD